MSDFLTSLLFTMPVCWAGSVQMVFRGFFVVENSCRPKIILMTVVRVNENSEMCEPVNPKQ